MLKNAHFLAKIGADTAEHEQQFAEILPIGRRVADRGGRRRLRAPPHRARGGPRPRGTQRERSVKIKLKIKKPILKIKTIRS